MKKNIILTVLMIPLLGIGIVSAGDPHHHNKTVPPMEHASDHADPKSDLQQGEQIYAMSCVYCHGSKGQGDGGASIFLGLYSHPRPNDFTRGIFKFRSTPSGQLPMLNDLIRTIRHGIPGIMPSFRNLGETGLYQVALYVKEAFIKRALPHETTIKYLEHIGPYTYSAESVQRGKKLYSEMGCAACHGEEGTGVAELFVDQRGLPIMPTDLTYRELFGNGIAHEDIYRTIMTGLDGTPMPSYGDAFAGKEESAWDLVHYVLSLSEF